MPIFMGESRSFLTYTPIAQVRIVRIPLSTSLSAIHTAVNEFGHVVDLFDGEASGFKYAVATFDSWSAVEAVLKVEKWAPFGPTALLVTLSQEARASLKIKVSPIAKHIDVSKIYGVFKEFGRMQNGMKGIENVRSGGFALIEYQRPEYVLKCLEHAAKHPILLGGLEPIKVEAFPFSSDSKSSFKSGPAKSKANPTPSILANSSNSAWGAGLTKEKPKATVYPVQTKPDHRQRDSGVASLASSSGLTEELKISTNQNWSRDPRRSDDSTPSGEFGGFHYPRIPPPPPIKVDRERVGAIQIRNIDLNLVPLEAAMGYFADVRQSGGGSVLPDRTYYKPDCNLAISEFGSSEDIERVLSKRSHWVGGRQIFVSALPPVSPRQVLVREVPAWVSHHRLSDYMEGRAKTDIVDLLFNAQGTQAIITYVADIDSPKLQSKIRERPMVCSVNGFEYYPNIAGVYCTDAVLLSALPEQLFQRPKLAARRILRDAIECCDALWAAASKGINASPRHVLMCCSGRDALIIFDSHKGAEVFLSQSFLLRLPDGPSQKEFAVNAKPFYDALDKFDYSSVF